jgi:hypothetical protein
MDSRPKPVGRTCGATWPWGVNCPPCETCTSAAGLRAPACGGGGGVAGDTGQRSRGSRAARGSAAGQLPRRRSRRSPEGWETLRWAPPLHGGLHAPSQAPATRCAQSLYTAQAYSHGGGCTLQIASCWQVPPGCGPYASMPHMRCTCCCQAAPHPMMTHGRWHRAWLLRGGGQRVCAEGKGRRSARLCACPTAA